MEINKLIKIIEDFAPLQTQEPWDCSGVQIAYNKDIKKVLLSLTVTNDIINQAQKLNCDMIIAHHPLFFIPFEFNKNIPIYSAHTNLDKADGGTTDTLINLLGFNAEKAQKIGDFLRLINLDKKLSLEDFTKRIKTKLKMSNLRIVNNKNKKYISKIAFCAGSGSEFLKEAEEINADIFVTGDVKFHTAIESNVIIADVEHFYSEQPVLNSLKKLLDKYIEVVIADEKSPFINY